MFENLQWKILIFASVALFTSPNAKAHSGGTIKSGPFKGCHNQTSDGSFHCHSSSRYPGKSWKSMADAVKELATEQMPVEATSEALSNAETGPAEASPVDLSPEAQAVSGTLPPTSALPRKAIPYDRSTWGQWSDLDDDCRNTRTEILIRDNLGEQIKNSDCEIKIGKWTDFYTDEIISSADEIEIDHVVSVKEAHDSGGMDWQAKKKTKFYNDPDNLVVTSRSTNRSKGANNFITWLPINKTRACEYAQRWLKVKRKYVLSLSPAEIKNFNALNCALKLGTVEKTAPLSEKTEGQ